MNKPQFALALVTLIYYLIPATTLFAQNQGIAKIRLSGQLSNPGELMLEDLIQMGPEELMVIEKNGA
ncbi:hypothetical protein [Cyclobacterium plantarum]|uniref:hypothetical protein n=1 Tax=Cyclobacterium plantarum TaxID=2716263 RepID=UPI003F728A58